MIGAAVEKQRARKHGKGIVSPGRETALWQPQKSPYSNLQDKPFKLKTWAFAAGGIVDCKVREWHGSALRSNGNAVRCIGHGKAKQDGVEQR